MYCLFGAGRHAVWNCLEAPCRAVVGYLGRTRASSDARVLDVGLPKRKAPYLVADGRSVVPEIVVSCRSVLVVAVSVRIHTSRRLAALRFRGRRRAFGGSCQVVPSQLEFL